MIRGRVLAAVRHRHTRVALRTLLTLALAITWVLVAWNVGAAR
jgi:hypothetical protein